LRYFISVVNEHTVAASTWAWCDKAVEGSAEASQADPLHRSAQLSDSLSYPMQYITSVILTNDTEINQITTFI